MLRITTAFLLLLGAAAVATAADEPGFEPLFNGKDLSGWKKHGSMAQYRVDGDTIVGELPGEVKGNTFLCTEKSYGNFTLKLECKLDIPGNSGVQFRSHIREKEDRVFGYQCEIDPSPRAWSAGIYDEARRGWLFPAKDDKKAQDEFAANCGKAFKLDGWNEFVIRAHGPWLRTWMNGVACADLLDAADLDGLIGLQVHAGKEGRIRFRNVRIKEYPPSKWEPLFDGKTLEGWKKQGGGEWTVKDGVIQGTSSKGESRHGHLISAKEYGDFAVRLKYKANKGNSGLYFRVEEGGAYGVKGFQAEIDPTNDIGGLYETDGRGWVVQPKPEDVKKWHKPGEWNEMVVIALGDRVVVQVNGVTTAELKKDAGRAKGHIALQLHGGQDMDVQFKDVEIQEIPKAED